MRESLGTTLPGPWHSANIRCSDRGFFVGEADIESAYTRVRALPWMWSYQCLPGVLAAEIMTQEELKNGEMASHRAHLPAWGPRCTVLSPTLHGTFLDRRNYVAYC